MKTPEEVAALYPYTDVARAVVDELTERDTQWSVKLAEAKELLRRWLAVVSPQTCFLMALTEATQEFIKPKK